MFVLVLVMLSNRLLRKQVFVRSEPALRWSSPVVRNRTWSFLIPMPRLSACTAQIIGGESSRSTIDRCDAIQNKEGRPRIACTL